MTFTPMTHVSPTTRTPVTRWTSPKTERAAAQPLAPLVSHEAHVAVTLHESPHVDPLPPQICHGRDLASAVEGRAHLGQATPWY